MPATTEMFKTDYRFIPKLPHDNYLTWREKVHRVLVAMRAYDIVTGDELLPEGNGSAARTLQKEWHRRANDAIAQIHLGCTDDLRPWIDDIDDRVEMWQTLQNWVDNTTYQVSGTEIVREFRALRPSKDEKTTQYFTRLIDLRKKLIGSPEAISDETMKTHIFSTMPTEFETTIKILEQHIPVPTAQQSWTDYKTMLNELNSQRRLETSQPDQLSTISIAEGMASTEDEEMNEAVDEEISAETAEETKTMIGNTAARTAEWTIIPPKAVAFSNDSKAEAEALTERRARKCSASTAENLAIWEPNAKVANEVSKPKPRSTNEALKTRWRKRIRHWHSMEFRLVIEIYLDYQTPLMPHLHRRLLHLRRGW